MTGFGEEQAHKVLLVDYGLAYRYCPDGDHKQYKEDPRKAHDGTIEFTSIDAHKGVSKSGSADFIHFIHLFLVPFEVHLAALTLRSLDTA